MSIRDEKLIIIDGACGTNIQQQDLPDEVWGEDYEGCNEYLNISAPEAIIKLHSSFLNVGAMVLETNTFGASSVVLSEYGLEDRVEEINHLAVAHAKTAIDGRPGRYIAGSIGPTTKLPSLNQISPADMHAAYDEQIRALVTAGVDWLMIETCQDLLQAKIAVTTAFGVLKELGRDIPVSLSVTIEPTGTMLVGTPISAVVAAFEPFPLFSLGLNCATGPQKMKSHLDYLSEHWCGRISTVPNAGMPELVNGEVAYPLEPDGFATALGDFVKNNGVTVVGGCCGTTPEHISQLKNALASIELPNRNPVYAPSLSSLFGAVEIAQEIPPLLIGERMNANGSKKFRKLLLNDDYESAVEIAHQQVAKGAHVLDLCTAYAGRDESVDLEQMLVRLSSSVTTPLVIDSTTPEAIEASLQMTAGRMVINSINLEDGGTTLDRVCGLAKTYGAAVVALPIEPEGMAMTADDKVAVAKDIYHRAVDQHGLRPSDIFFDMLTFTIGSGDPSLKDAAEQTLLAITRIKKDLPGVFTVLGLSNVSFGLPKAARKVLNSVFLAHAIDAGLDAAIVDAGNIRSLASIPDEEREISRRLIFNSPGDDGADPLASLIEFYDQRSDDEKENEKSTEGQTLETQLERKLQGGDSSEIADLLHSLLQRYSPLEIINEILIPEMRRVGDLFGRGEMLLPFVLKSAEVMKFSVDILEPLLDKVENEARTRVLLATVQGDVHDIGKNLVDIILSNNGYEVFNIGTNVSTEKIIEQAAANRVNVIGLSGLLVKSAIVMQKSMPQYAEANLDVPILLGGAALTPKFVAESCVPTYPLPVVYCPDAFAGLKAVQRYEQGQLEATQYEAVAKTAASTPAPRMLELKRDNPVPEVPFKGERYITELPTEVLFKYLNKQALFRGRWGYRRAKMPAADYAALIKDKVEPLYESLKEEIVEGGLAVPQVAYGYFDCYAKDETVWVESNGTAFEFEFPRRSIDPQLCIADYYKNKGEGGDVVGFFVVTLGSRIATRTAELYENNNYHDYLMLHGLAVELTDALAEYWHEMMRREMGIETTGPDSIGGYVNQSYQGSRYGFGYPACPDMDAHTPLFALLKPDKIGVSLTENMQMVPEVTTSAIVAHHPQAKYFAV